MSPSSSAPVTLHFGPFVLEATQARLCRDGQALDLPPKAYEVLCFLAERAGRLVTKDELLDAVWGHRHLSDSVLKTTINTIRSVLGDDARSPRYVETVARRGYRFIGASAAPVPHPGGAGTGSQLIGRDAPWQRLEGAWQAARGGQRQLVLVAGEPGVGKSTLINGFCAQADRGVHTVGQCVEQYGTGEPYLPMLEALNLLCRRDPAVLGVLRQVAPTWLVQLPWHLSETDRVALQHQVAGSTQERMLREMGELLERLAAERPLLLVLEDLHWSDPATVRLLDHLMRRRSMAKLMLVGSFRPAELVLNEHAFADLRRELRLHRLCEELTLEGFTVAQIADYLAHRFGQAGFEADFVEALHRHTDGLPLFVASVLDELVDAGIVTQVQGVWSALPQAGSRLPVPENLAGVIDKQVQRLPGESRMLLEAAALAGAEFQHLMVADALGLDAGAVQSRLDGLVRRQLWLRSIGGQTLPDGRLAARYAFRHALFRHVFAQRSTPPAQLVLHRRLGESLQRSHGDRAGMVAVELAHHAELGEQPAQAAAHLAQAAHNALARLAPREAVQLAERGLALVDTLPVGSTDAELPLLAARISGLVVTRGYSAPEVVETIDRALVRLNTHPLSTVTLPLWHSIWWMLATTGRLERAAEVARRLQAAADVRTLPAARAVALNLLGAACLHEGKYAIARDLLEEGWALQQAGVEQLDQALFIQNPAIECLAHLNLACEFSGAFERAQQVRDLLLARVDQGTDPLSETMGLWFAAYAYQCRREPERAAPLATRALRVMEQRDAMPGAGPHRVTMGWVHAMRGTLPLAAALDLAEEGVRTYQAQGTRMGLDLMLTLLAEVQMMAGRHADARQALAAAQQIRETLGFRFAQAESSRLWGELALATGEDRARARDWFDEAVARAREQGCVLFEALAMASLARHLETSGDGERGRAMLAEVLTRLDAMPGAPTLDQARRLLGPS